MDTLQICTFIIKTLILYEVRNNHVWKICWYNSILYTENSTEWMLHMVLQGCWPVGAAAREVSAVDLEWSRRVDGWPRAVLPRPGQPWSERECQSGWCSAVLLLYYSNSVLLLGVFWIAAFLFHSSRCYFLGVIFLFLTFASSFSSTMIDNLLELTNASAYYLAPAWWKKLTDKKTH